MTSTTISTDDTRYDDPVPIGYYDHVARRDGIQATWHRLKFERVRAMMGEFESHLDIACGPGTFIASIDRGRSFGVDIAAAQLAYARETHGTARAAWVACLADRLPFAPESFDVVTSIELIEHIPESAALAMLRSARGLLRPGGRLILTTPNYRSPWLALEPLVSIIGEVDYRKEHIERYNRQRLAGLLELAGFSEMSIEAFQLAAPFAAPFGRMAVELVARLDASGPEQRAGCLLLAEAKA